MGEIILSQAGAVVGQAALPNGVGAFGAHISGAALGGAIGSLAGRAVDASLQPSIEGPRIKALHVMESREGAGMANVYGRMRVGGQLIWASRFREKRRERSAGKGGPKIADYSYSVSLAVAITEGPVTRLDRVWANGETLALSEVNWRFYKGHEDQLPDPLIEAVEGAGEAPAFRGTAYIVFEDLPLDAFGNRLPQLSFEVVRASSETSGLRQAVTGVNLIPATGEFVYGTHIVRERRFPGIERPLNMNNGTGETDFVRSLDQLDSDLPGVAHAALTVAWFGNDLRAGQCRIHPGVETRERATVPYGWEVAGQRRGDAYLVSQSGGSANYGGTPADRAVIEGIQAMKAQGLAVTLTPFLLMDVPPGNGLPDPYGGAEQAAFPWRGRITVEADGTAAARTEINAFVGADGGFGYRHFILHHARLAVEAGGVEAMLIGSEMVALTRVRDEAGAFPFVEALVALAAEVKAIVGPGTKVSYAADWTEYGAYVPGDGSGDVLFPLDPLWASGDVDFIGVDWYPPAGDWRDGESHFDALAGFGGADDPAYLESQMAGGEAYDWYYASEAHRDAQLRTPISDTAHGEDWVFRQKDLAGWWGAPHHERPGGVREVVPTGWVAGSKPVRLMEIGFPAVDKGTSAPNLFYDPKSAESGLPPYSSGARNDVLQRRALEVALGWWQAQPFVERAFVWAWDGRPWPDFPARAEVWNDGPNWSLGHWLNGRTGLISLAEMAEDLAARADVSLDASAVPGLVEGVVLDGPMPLRRALEPFRSLYGLGCSERDTGLQLTVEGAGQPVEIETARLAENLPQLTRPLLDKRPGRLALSYISADGSYAPALSEARRENGDAAYSVDASVPLVLSEGVATALAGGLLAGLSASETAQLALLPEEAWIEPGDRLSCEAVAGDWVVRDITDDGLLRRVSLSRPAGRTPLLALTPPEAAAPAAPPAAPALVLIDGPAIRRGQGDGPLLAVAGEPWRRGVAVSAGLDEASLSVRATIAQPAAIGTLAEPFEAGPAARWDRANTLLIDMADAGLSSTSPAAVLAGANRLLVAGEAGWELVGFISASLEGEDRWRLSGLLRGLNGSAPAQALAGAVCLIADDRLVEGVLQPTELGLPLVWQAGAAAPVGFTHHDEAGLPWPVAHLRAKAGANGSRTLSWVPCGPEVPDNWDLPDPVGSRSYLVEAESAGAIVSSQMVDQAAVTLPAGPDLVRVAEIGADGRHGAWVSITLGAS